MRKTLFQVIRFGVVGVIATTTYFLMGQGLNYTTTLNALQIHVVAFAVSIIISYLGHAHFTFGISGRQPMIRFVVISVVLFCASSGLTVMLSDRLGISNAWIVTVITIVYPVCSFLLHRFWTFKLPHNSQ